MYCGDTAPATLDHIVPISRGGARNALENLVLACRDCNVAKDDRTPTEWKPGHPWSGRLARTTSVHRNSSGSKPKLPSARPAPPPRHGLQDRPFDQLRWCAICKAIRADGDCPSWHTWRPLEAPGDWAG